MLSWCSTRRLIILFVCIVLTAITVFIPMYGAAWLKNYGKLASAAPLHDSSLVAKVDPPKTRYKEPLHALMELVSPKDPKCQPDNSSSDPYSQLNTAEFTSLAELLLSYRQQHIRWRKLLLEGEVEKIRTLTWYCDSGCAGLGDRVRGIWLSLVLAMISNRLFLVQWRQPFEVERQNNLFMPSAIDWNVDQALADKLSKLSTESVRLPSGSSREQRVNRIEDYIINTKYRHVRIQTNIHFNNIVKLGKLFSNRVRENKRFQIFMNVADHLPVAVPPSIQGVLVRYLFKFSPPVLKKADELCKEMNMSDTQQYVAANIRSGFLGTLNERAVKMAVTPCQWESIVDPAVKKSKQLGKNVPVVLCTDSDKVKSWAREHYNGTVILVPRKPIHIATMIKNVDDKSNTEIETVAEVVLMSRALFLFRTFRNGFTSVAGQMCPFVILVP